MKIIEKSEDDVVIQFTWDELSSIVEVGDCHGCKINIAPELFRQLQDIDKSS